MKKADNVRMIAALDGGAGSVCGGSGASSVCGGSGASSVCGGSAITVTADVTPLSMSSSSKMSSTKQNIDMV